MPKRRRGTNSVNPPVFVYDYPDGFTAQNSMETLQLNAGRKFVRSYKKRADSVEEFKAPFVAWFWELVKGYASRIARIPRSRWTAADRRNALYDYASKAAGAAGISGPAFARLIDCETWHTLVVRASRLHPSSRHPPRRAPNLDISQQRVKLYDQLRSELAIIKTRLRTYCEDVSTLKAEYPGFELWKHIRQDELDEIYSDERFSPGSYATTITLRVSGVSSPETLKKDRKKLKKASESASR